MGAQTLLERKDLRVSVHEVEQQSPLGHCILSFDLSQGGILLDKGLSKKIQMSLKYTSS